MATMSARYTVINDEVVAQERGVARHQLVPDPLGSITAIYSNSGTKTDTLEYWPYGETSGRTGTTPVAFQYVGAFGYYSGNINNFYVRARYFNNTRGRWVTKDPIADGLNHYIYVDGNPKKYVDPTGLIKFNNCDIEQQKEINGIFQQLCYKGRKNSSPLDRLDECVNGCDSLGMGGGPGACTSNRCNQLKPGAKDELVVTCGTVGSGVCEKTKKSELCGAGKPEFGGGSIVICFGSLACPTKCTIAHELIHTCRYTHPNPDVFACINKNIIGCEKITAK